MSQTPAVDRASSTERSSKTSKTGLAHPNPCGFHADCPDSCKSHVYDAVICHAERDGNIAFEVQQKLQEFDELRIELIENIFTAPYIKSLDKVGNVTPNVIVLFTKTSFEDNRMADDNYAIWAKRPGEGFDIIPILYGFGDDENPPSDFTLENAHFVRYKPDEAFFLDTMKKRLLRLQHKRLQHDDIREACEKQREGTHPKMFADSSRSLPQGKPQDATKGKGQGQKQKAVPPAADGGSAAHAVLIHLPESTATASIFQRHIATSLDTLDQPHEQERQRKQTEGGQEKVTESGTAGRGQIEEEFNGLTHASEAARRPAGHGEDWSLSHNSDAVSEQAGAPPRQQPVAERESGTSLPSEIVSDASLACRSTSLSTGSTENSKDEAMSTAAENEHSPGDEIASGNRLSATGAGTDRKIETQTGDQKSFADSQKDIADEQKSLAGKQKSLVGEENSPDGDRKSLASDRESRGNDERVKTDGREPFQICPEPHCNGQRAVGYEHMSDGRDEDAYPANGATDAGQPTVKAANDSAGSETVTEVKFKPETRARTVERLRGARAQISRPAVSANTGSDSEVCPEQPAQETHGETMKQKPVGRKSETMQEPDEKGRCTGLEGSALAGTQYHPEPKTVLDSSRVVRGAVDEKLPVQETCQDDKGKKELEFYVNESPDFNLLEEHILYIDDPDDPVPSTSHPSPNSAKKAEEDGKAPGHTGEEFKRKAERDGKAPTHTGEEFKKKAEEDGKAPTHTGEESSTQPKAAAFPPEPENKTAAATRGESNAASKFNIGTATTVVLGDCTINVTSAPPARTPAVGPIDSNPLPAPASASGPVAPGDDDDDRKEDDEHTARKLPR